MIKKILLSLTMAVGTLGFAGSTIAQSHNCGTKGTEVQNSRDQDSESAKRASTEDRKPLRGKENSTNDG